MDLGSTLKCYRNRPKVSTKVELHFTGRYAGRGVANANVREPPLDHKYVLYRWRSVMVWEGEEFKV